MEKAIPFVLLISLASFVSSCCTKKYCLGFDNLNEIQLLNFSVSDTDSIAFETFTANSNFASRIDSSLVTARGRHEKDSSLIIFMPEKVNINRAYKITFRSTKQVYTIANFSVRKEKCNCMTDRYNVLDSYSLNGERVNHSLLVISK